MGGVVQLVHVSFTPDLVAVDVVHLVDLGLTRVDVGEALTRVACGRFQPGWLKGGCVTSQIGVLEVA